jgi:hypothetical protein
MTAKIIPTRRPLYSRLLALACEHLSLASTSLRALDRRTPADLGVDPSEIASIFLLRVGRHDEPQ